MNPTDSLSAFGPAITLCALLSLGSASHAQEVLRYSVTGADAAEARSSRAQNQQATLISGDFRLSIRPSLGIRYNDNITLVDGEQLSDAIFSPMLDVQASYPLTERNTFSLSLAAGYDFYLDHSDFNDWMLRPGSRIGFDIYVGQLWLNLHNQFSYIQSPSSNPSVSGTGSYAEFNNTAGISGTWDLENLVVTVGYDYFTFISGTDEFDYLNRGTHLPLARAGYRVHSALLAGLETTGSFTQYREPVLNDNIGISAGAYAEWQLSEYLKLSPRAGYASYFFDQTSQTIPAEDQGAWYASLLASHQVNHWISYSLQAGHELRLGTTSDLVRAWFVRPQVSLNLIRDVRVTVSLPYEYGINEGSANDESHHWFAPGLGLSKQLLDRLSASLNYRFTYRSSDTGGDYTQNVVELQLTYRL